MAAMLVVHMAGLPVRRVRVGVTVVRVVMVVRVMVVAHVMMMRMTMRMVVMMCVHCRSRAHALRRAQPGPFAEKSPPLGVKKLRAHQGDQPVAHDLDPPHGGAHGLCR